MTVSVCMIVKNEEKLLARCLDSLKGLYDELVIVDTGSTDRTRQIAGEYTDNIYDFSWQDDFSAARNFAFSKCSCDYIYSADADEYLDETNRTRFRDLIMVLDPAVEIVQMHYYEPKLSGLLNTRSELRPKLFKRIRTFRWVDPVHESVQTEPLVFDSDIVIIHAPESLHSSRDFSIFEKAYSREGRLSKRLYSMYAIELYRNGGAEELRHGALIFSEVIDRENPDQELLIKLLIILAVNARKEGNISALLKYASRLLACDDPCSEVCLELGRYFFDQGDYKEASLWFYNATIQQSALDIHSSTDLPCRALGICYAHLSEQADGEESDRYREAAEEYERRADQFQIPEE